MRIRSDAGEIYLVWFDDESLDMSMEMTITTLIHIT